MFVLLKMKMLSSVTVMDKKMRVSALIHIEVKKKPTPIAAHSSRKLRTG